MLQISLRYRKGHGWSMRLARWPWAWFRHRYEIRVSSHETSCQGVRWSSTGLSCLPLRISCSVMVPRDFLILKPILCDLHHFSSFWASPMFSFFLFHFFWIQGHPYAGGPLALYGYLLPSINGLEPQSSSWGPPESIVDTRALLVIRYDPHV